MKFLAVIMSVLIIGCLDIHHLFPLYNDNNQIVFDSTLKVEPKKNSIEKLIVRPIPEDSAYYFEFLDSGMVPNQGIGKMIRLKMGLYLDIVPFDTNCASCQENTLFKHVPVHSFLKIKKKKGKYFFSIPNYWDLENALGKKVEIPGNGGGVDNT